MAAPAITYSVFTKPWKTPVPELARFVRGLGFDGVEFPVRPGYQVEPEHILRDLPIAARQFADEGIRITSVAAEADLPTIEACAAAGVPVIRTMARVPGPNYTETVAALQREYEALVPGLRDHGVVLGVQNHCGRFVPNALALRELLAPLDPQCVAAVWDAAHEALQGAEMDHALDVIWPRLCMVNLKNGMWQRTNGPEAEHAEWRHYWTSGRHGLCSWPLVVSLLKERGYRGIVCLTAEYSDHGSADRLIAEDMAFARALFGI